MNIRLERAEGDALRIDREAEAEGLAQEQVKSDIIEYNKLDVNLVSFHY